VTTSSFRLPAVRPFDFFLTASYATRFRGRHGAETFVNGVFQRVLTVCGQPVLITATASVDHAGVEVTLSSNQPVPQDTATFEVRRLLGLGVDLSPFYAMADGDPALAPLARRFRGMHVPQAPSLLEALVVALLGQQISGAVATALRNRLVDALGQPLQVEGNVHRAFPDARGILNAGVDGLRSLGLTRRKSEYAVEIAHADLDGLLERGRFEKMPDDQVRLALTALRGVGMWTADWTLLNALGRSDAFPQGDLVLRRMVAEIAGRPQMTADETLDFSRLWAPFRSYVTAYLFASARSARAAASC
jgi:DNA-3-methyladenine glycosylase II